MKLLRGVALLALVAWVAWVTLAIPTSESAARRLSTPEPAVPGRMQPGDLGQDRRIAELEQRIATLAQELRSTRSGARTTVPPVSLVENRGSDDPARETSPEWYLEQYVLSFEGGGRGSEYFRLAVEAYAPSLLADISKLVTSSGADPLLRQKLVEMLGDPRFFGWTQAIDALLSVIDTSRVTDVTHGALVSLRRVGDRQTARALEQVLWSIQEAGLQREAINTVVALAGPAANEAVLRMIARAPDDATRAYLVTLFQLSQPDVALDGFRYASGLNKPVRLQAALHIANFRTDAIKAFVDEWAASEPDEDVRNALGLARGQLNQVPGWSALQATGPPDANPNRDDSNAWASKVPDMGEQWLELEYATPMKVHTVRIFEVNVAGCVTQVIGYTPSGRSQVLWSGTDPTETPQVFEVSFTTTRAPLARIKLVLDTNRRSGWSEIDAVEIVGPAGRAWAEGARASSSYGR